jgi:ribose transport system substrate-binding protein
MSPRSWFCLILGATTGFALGIAPMLQPKLPAAQIAFIPRTSGTIPTERMHRAAARAAHEEGFRLYWNAPAREDDVDRQIALLSSALESGTKGLIVGPTNGLALISKLNEFIAHRVPIVVIQTDTPIPQGPYITAVVPDQREVARLAGQRMTQLLRPGAEVGVVGIDQASPEAVERARHFVAYLKENSGLKVVIQQQGTSLVPEAEQNVNEVLDAFPHLAALFAVTAAATEGAVQAMERRHPKHGVVLIGCDEYMFLNADLRDGKLDSVVMPDADQIGYVSAKTLLEGIHAGTLSRSSFLPIKLVTRASVE